MAIPWSVALLVIELLDNSSIDDSGVGLYTTLLGVKLREDFSVNEA